MEKRNQLEIEKSKDILTEKYRVLSIGSGTVDRFAYIPNVEIKKPAVVFATPTGKVLWI